MKYLLRTGFLRPSSRWGSPAGIASAVAIVAAALMCVPGPAQALPDDMAYEMVTPVHKNGLDAGTGGFAGNYRASADGDSLLYQALGAWGDAPNYAIGGVYLAKRGTESWSSHSAMLPIYPGPLFNGSGVPAFSRDFSKVIGVTNLDFATGGEASQPNAYLLDPISKERDRLTPDALAPLPLGVNPGNTLAYAGNDDFSTLFFASPMTLTDDTLTGHSGNVNRLYRYSDGELTLASRLPGGEAVNGMLPLFSDGYGGGSVRQQPTNILSEDADVIYFRSQESISWMLYRRDFSGPTPTTDLVNADENSEEIPVSGDVAKAFFAGASADGGTAYFTSRQRLVDADTDTSADIFRYDQSKPEGSRLTLVSVDEEPGDPASGTGNSYGVSDDGKTLFFSSESQLVAGESTEPGAKLFAYHDGELRFIALTGDPVALIESGGADDGTANSAWSDNDKYFGFISGGPDITAEDNGGIPQAYRYEVATDQLECVSCLDGAANTTAASWRRNVGVSQLAYRWVPIRNIADDGTVFFQTAEALAGADTNGKVDVYAWQDGEPELISSGRSTDNSWLMDASADGNTIFFLTRSRLARWDNDDLLDVYAARVGGGLPKPGQAQVPPCDGSDCIPLPPDQGDDSICTGGDCFGPPSERPQFTDPGTADIEGAGNAAPKPADCKRLDRKAKRQQRKAKRQVKRFRSAKGKKAKHRAKRKATKAKHRAKRKAKQAKKQANRSAKRAERCQRGVGR